MKQIGDREKMNTSGQNTSVEQEIQRMEQIWIDTYLKNDADTFSNYLTEDFLYTSPSCEVVDRATYISNLRDNTIHMDYITPSDMLIRVHGDTAIVTATWMVKEQYKETEASGPHRIIRIWLKYPDGWRAVAFQVTACSPQQS